MNFIFLTMPVQYLMLVDDDEDDREIFLSVVENISPSTICEIAINGQDALNKITTGKRLPEMIFLDLNMPLMDGRQFLVEIGKMRLRKDIPVFILSTSSDKDSIAQSLDLGAKGFITKPDRYSGWEQALKSYLSPTL